MQQREKVRQRIANAERFEVEADLGLSSAQVATRRKEKLTNKKRKQVTKTYPRILFENLFNELNVILFCLFGLMLYAGLKFVRFFFIIILAANIGIGLIQDVHARVLVERLKVVSDPKTVVIRDGREQEILVKDIVYSDIIVLKTGDQVPADCVIRCGNVHVNESLLTGEQDSVKKAEGETLLSGSYLVSGTCKAQVVAVGAANFAENLEESAKSFKRPQSEIQHSIWVIMTFCCVCAISMGVLMTASFMIPRALAGEDVWAIFFPMTDVGRGFIDSLSGSMVAMLPAGMFLLTSLTLAVGVILLAKRKMLVQQLYCIEMLARVDVLCLDKTGTLTDGSMEVVEALTLNKRQPSEIGYAVSAILKSTGDSNATALALKAKYGDASSLVCHYAKPFDSESKYSAVGIQGVGSYFLGAYGFVPSKKDKAVEELIQSYSKKGFRCLLLSSSTEVILDNKPAKKIENLAILVLSDHLKEDARENIEHFQEQGVIVKVISGDDVNTVSDVAKRAGVVGADLFISLEKVPLEEVGPLATRYNVFGRVSPEQKAELIKAIKEQGHKVAMTGDGINDILALKIADCSIAMANGSGATRSMANLVSLDSDFSKLPDVVAQGRRVINNLQRTCTLFLSKTTFAILLSLGFLINQTLGGRPYPFTTSNLFVWEVVAIGVAAFFLALQPSKDRLKGSFIRNILTRAFPAGLAEVFAAGVPMVLYKIWPASYSYMTDPDALFAIAKTLSAINFSAVSFFVLFRVCIPLDRYRAVVFGSMTAIGTGIFVADFFLRGELLDLTWDGFKWSFILVSLILIGLCAAVYYLLDLFVVKHFLKKEHVPHEN